MERKKPNMLDFFFKSSTKNIVKEVKETISKQNKTANLDSENSDNTNLQEIPLKIEESLSSTIVSYPYEIIEIPSISDSPLKKSQRKKLEKEQKISGSNLIATTNISATFHCKYKSIDLNITPVINFEQYQRILREEEGKQNFIIKMKRIDCFSNILKVIYKKLKISDQNQLLLTYQGAVLFESTQFISFELEKSQMKIGILSNFISSGLG